MLLALLMSCALRSPPPEVPEPAVAGPRLAFAQGAGAFDLSTGPWAAPGVPVEGCAGGRALVLEVSLDAVRLGGEAVVGFGPGAPPVDLQRRVQTALSAWMDATRARQVLCGEAGEPTLGLALHPDLPWKTARAVLMGVGMAGVHRQAVLVAGAPGAPLVEGEPPDRHVQVSATLGVGGPRYARPQVGLHEPVDGPWDVALPQLLGGGELGCAVIALPEGLRFGDAVAEMGSLSAAGARRFVLADARAPTVPLRGGTERPTAPVSLTGTVAAFLMELPQIEPTPPDHELHSGSECSPVLYADFAPRP